MKEWEKSFWEYNCVFSKLTVDNFAGLLNFQFCFNIIYHATQFYLVIFLIFNVQMLKNDDAYVPFEIRAYVMPYNSAEMCCVCYNNIGERQTTIHTKNIYGFSTLPSLYCCWCPPVAKAAEVVANDSSSFSHLFTFTNLFSSLFSTLLAHTLGILPIFFSLSLSNAVLCMTTALLFLQFYSSIVLCVCACVFVCL